MKCLRLLIAALSLSLFYFPVVSQCVDVLSNNDLLHQPPQVKGVVRAQKELARLRASPGGWLTEAQIKERNAQWADEDMLEEKAKAGLTPLPPVAVSVTLEAGKYIKLLVDNDADSNVNRAEDYVQFSVGHEVYGITADGKKRCLVIPKDTKVFGIVDYVKGRTPFRLKGKARIYVYVDRIMLADETLIPIEFAKPEGLVGGTDGRTRKDAVVKTCEIARNKKCIVGRLSKTTFSPTLIGAGAGGLIQFQAEDTTTTGAALGLVRDLGNASGITEFINQSHSGLKQKQVFEVRTISPRTIKILTKKPEAKETPVKP